MVLASNKIGVELECETQPQYVPDRNVDLGPGFARLTSLFSTLTNGTWDALFASQNPDADVVIREELESAIVDIFTLLTFLPQVEEDSVRALQSLEGPKLVRTKCDTNGVLLPSIANFFARRRNHLACSTSLALGWFATLVNFAVPFRVQGPTKALTQLPTVLVLPFVVSLFSKLDKILVKQVFKKFQTLLYFYHTILWTISMMYILRLSGYGGSAALGILCISLFVFLGALVDALQESERLRLSRVFFSCLMFGAVVNFGGFVSGAALLADARIRFPTFSTSVSGLAYGSISYIFLFSARNLNKNISSPRSLVVVQSDLVSVKLGPAVLKVAIAVHDLVDQESMTASRATEVDSFPGKY